MRCCRLRTPQSSNVPPPLTAGGDLQRAPSNRVGRDSRAMTREEKTRLNDFRALQYEMELKIKATQQMEKEMQGLKVERELATTELTNLRRRLASVEQERDRLHDELEQANARLGKFASCAPLPRCYQAESLMGTPGPRACGGVMGGSPLRPSRVAEPSAHERIDHDPDEPDRPVARRSPRPRRQHPDAPSAERSVRGHRAPVRPRAGCSRRVLTAGFMHTVEKLELVGLDGMDKLGHRFNRANFAAPTRCDHCHLLILGLTRQGVSCDGLSRPLPSRATTASASPPAHCGIGSLLLCAAVCGVHMHDHCVGQGVLRCGMRGPCCTR